MKKMNKVQRRMFDLAHRNQGQYETKKYVYRDNWDGTYYRIEKCRFGTTAILEPEAFEYFCK